MTIRTLILSSALLLCGLTATAAGQSTGGAGWTLSRIDLDVRVLPAEGRMELEGTLQLRLDDFDSSFGPALYLGVSSTQRGDAAMDYTSVECPGAAVERTTKPLDGATHRALLRFGEAKHRGDTISVGFSAESKGHASQLVVREEFAMASWTAAWHPFTAKGTDTGLQFNVGHARIPGRTRLHLPAGWIGIVDGSLVERQQTDSGTVEVWETPEGIARGFAAGPYKAVTESVDGREVHVYMLSDDKAVSPQRLARLVADSMAAQEARLGPFPFSSYGVVERPSKVPAQGWYAASQQTFIVASSIAFDYPQGNLPLWGHEMAHGWWGNTVSQTGPGSKWVGEALAQLGALIAIETLEGPAALREFLAYSRSGYSPVQCASGYFGMVREGQDQVLSQMGQGALTHALANSKGVWIYHMLRQIIGDEVFFGVLRGVIADLSPGVLSVEELRRRFAAAAPGHDLEAFFAQWLDRTGAPIFGVDWYANADGRGLVVKLTQAQEGPPFSFDLDVEIELAEGQRVIETVEIRDTVHTFQIPTSARPSGVRLDPNFKVLLWKPEFGPRPGDVLPSEVAAPKEILDAVVGRYRLRGVDAEVVMYVEGGSLMGRIAGEATVRLIHVEDGLFRVDVAGGSRTANFDLSASPSPSLLVTQGPMKITADRVQD